MVTHAATVSSLQVRSTLLRFDAFPALRRLTLAGGLFKELRLPARLRQLTLGAGLMYNDISGAHLTSATSIFMLRPIHAHLLPVTLETPVTNMTSVTMRSPSFCVPLFC